MKIIETFSDSHIRQLHHLYQKEWWTNARTLEETSQVVKNSTLALGIVNEQDELVGFVRVLSDLVFKAMIFDLIVREDMRSKGLGDLLIGKVLSHLKFKSVRHFELYCLPEMEKYYAKYGFENTNADLVLMRRNGL